MTGPSTANEHALGAPRKISLGSDSDLDELARLQIPDAVVAAAIGKTRQAIHAGLRTRARYLKDHEIVRLRAALVRQNPAIISSFDEFVRVSRPDLTLAPSVGGRQSDASDQIEAANHVWIVAPEWTDLALSYPTTYRLICSLVHAKSRRIVFMTSLEKELLSFRRSVENFQFDQADHTDAAGSDAFMVCGFADSVANAFPYTIFTNPIPGFAPPGQAEDAAWRFAAHVLIEDGFYTISRQRAISMRNYIEESVSPIGRSFLHFRPVSS